MGAIKEELAYVALDFDEMLCVASTVPVHPLETSEPCPGRCQRRELPDGNVVVVCSQRFRTPEALFRPSLLGREGLPGIHELVFQAVMKCEETERTQLFGNIVLSGGNTLFPGIAERLTKELATLLRLPNQPPSAETVEVNVVAPPGRKHSAWLGASMLALE